MPEDPLAGYDLTPAERERMLAHIAGGGDVGSWQRGDRPPARQTYGDRVGWEDMSPEERRALGLVDEESQYKDADYWWKQWWRQNTAEGRADTSKWANEPRRTPEGGWQNITGGTPAIIDPAIIDPALDDEGTLGNMAGRIPPTRDIDRGFRANPFDWGTGDRYERLKPTPELPPELGTYQPPGSAVTTNRDPRLLDPRRRGTLAGMLRGQYY